MLCMSLGLVMLLSLWEIRCTGYSEIAPPTTISLVTTKQCSKLISKTKEICFPDDLPSGKEEDCGHDLQKRPHCMKTTDG
jgi:hypothetical protein